jgi:DNA-binding NarL/FixJ family response regulator
MGRISVVIADRHPVVLCGLSGLLEAQRDFKIVASCSDSADCLEALRTFRPTIAIIDVALPKLSSLELISFVNSEQLPTRLVFFAPSRQDREFVVSSAINGHSIFLKDMAPEALLLALRQVAEERYFLAPSLSEDPIPFTPVLENALTMLTDRERQIALLASEGLSNKAIARRLNVTDGTVKVHLHHVFQKLQVSNRTVLAALAIAPPGSASTLTQTSTLSQKRGRSRTRPN